MEAPAQRGHPGIELAAPSPGARPPVVAVAMSGGVDSSVAAALCVEAGLRVFGIMLRLWSEPGATGANKCCSLAAVSDAQAVAYRLGIPFSVIDATALFKDRVVDAFVTAAGSGDTPNPCFTCNRRVRFGFLLDQARALGADYLATGHYARVGRAADGSVTLRRGVDADKDQSYVLHRLDQAQLRHVLFPVGGLAKSAVRAEAARLGLAVAARPDSVDLCWLGDDGVAGFLGRALPAAAVRPGPIVDLAGHVLGTHRGLPLYTIGQRRGLGLAAGVPLYVTGKDPVANALIVGPAVELAATVVRAADWHWIAGQPPGATREVTAQVRYRGQALPGRLEVDDPGIVRFHCATPQRAPAPGQGLVAYQGDVCLGGGRIVAAPAA
jgi:tRNA-uridine 2-sulfurtransferase